MLDDPLRDEEGIVTPHDHAQILNQDVIIKRVTENDVVREGDITRISTSLFSASSDKYAGSSVNIEKVILGGGGSVSDYCSQFPGVIGAISFTANSVRINGGKVGFEPLDSDPAHGEIWDLKAKGKIKDVLRAAEVAFGLADLTYIFPPKA